MVSESREVATFRKWLTEHNAYIHSELRFVKDCSGLSIYALRHIPQETRVVACPFSLAITADLSRRELHKITRHPNHYLDALSERELICTYLILHWIIEEVGDDGIQARATGFIYSPYLRVLPPPDALRTPLHFNEEELSLLKGTNLFGATVDRRTDWQAEWKRCQRFVSSVESKWESLFTWERYLTVSTYLSSRAFPSTILSRTPSLISSSSSYPVLLPGFDSFNHSRTQRVSWVIDNSAQTDMSSTPDPDDWLQVSLVIHSDTPANTEVCNNYGLKPNSELILGYGFSLPSNPEDTIVLKIGGHSSRSDARWEVGRHAQGAEALWQELRKILGDDSETRPAEWEIDLEAAEALREMIESKLSNLPHLPATATAGVREDVLAMIQNYVLGQRDILEALFIFAGAKREAAIKEAKEDGVELLFEDDDGED